MEIVLLGYQIAELILLAVWKARAYYGSIIVGECVFTYEQKRLKREEMKDIMKKRHMNGEMNYTSKSS